MNPQKEKIRLSHKDREFFSMVRTAAFANPFSDERVEIDLKIIEMPHDLSPDERVRKLTDTVHERIRLLDMEGRCTIDQFDDPDRELIRIGFLFDFFHQFIDHFDNFILDQLKAGDRSLKVSFFDDACAMLTQRGFNTGEISRYLSLCYQIRRAYFFILRNLIGRSPCMKELRRNLWNNVFTHDIGLYELYLWNRMEDFSTLILGETGSGKGTVAAAIGRSGYIPFDIDAKSFVESFTRSFLAINLSQYPESLIESELFGHKKGAFTGAVEDYQGIFDHCSPYGSIFLDEIGEVSTPIQIKLLQVLQERFFYPVGSHKKRRFQGRVIAATNRPIQEISKNGGLRDDFLYRLCSDIIIVPPLRQRIQEDADELTDLLAYVIEKILGRPSPEIVEMVVNVIQNQLGLHYLWRGNVRELEQCVRRVLLKCQYEGDLKTAMHPDLRFRLIEAIDTGNMDAQRLISAYCSLLYRRLGTYEAVSRKTNLDRRTVKKHIEQWKNS